MVYAHCTSTFTRYVPCATLSAYVTGEDEYAYTILKKKKVCEQSVLAVKFVLSQKSRIRKVQAAFLNKSYGISMNIFEKY